MRDLRRVLSSEFPDRELNVEGFPDARFLALAKEVRADQVTLVPDAPDQHTGDHGWNFAVEQSRLTEVVADLKNSGHRVTLFADADARQLEDAAATGADRVELYTGPYGGAYRDSVRQEAELSRLAKAVMAASQNGLDVNAGHELTVDGTARLVTRIRTIAEVFIGHALFCDALTFGMDETVRRYLGSCAPKAGIAYG